nr:isocitrate lyase/phosphoenolpyruvate mutase family protein [Protofrankia symbiont of Coriaria ruscifolia]
MPRCGLAPDCLLIARTEALVAELGVAEALNRANRYVDAGADAVFVQATKPDGGRELLEFAQRWGRRTPVFIAPTCYPALGVEHYTRAGITHWIFANQLLRTSYRAMDDVARQIEKAKTGPAPQLEDQIASVQETAIALGAYEDEELED